jgi:hypothetical protein
MMGWFKNLFRGGEKAALSGEAAAVLPALFDVQSWEMLVNQLVEMPDPDRVLERAGLDRVELEKLTYDDEIFQAIQTREDGLQRVPIRLEPTESAASKFIMERCFGGDIKRTIISGAFKALLYGWSIQEIVWDRGVYEREGLFVPRDISQRSIRYFTVRPDGTLVQAVIMEGEKKIVRVRGLQERISDVMDAGYSWVVMDTRYKFLLTRSRPSWDNPYGEALLSRLYWPWFFRNVNWKFLAQYLERYAIPILVGTLPPESTASTGELAKELMRAQQDAVVAMKGGSLTAVNPNSTGHELYQRVEEMLTRRIQKVVLGQTLTSGTDGGSGNRALGEVHENVRKDKVESDIGLIQSTVQTYVNACFELNGFSGAPPEVIFGDEVNLAASRAARDKILIESGMVSGFSEDYLMDNYGFRPGELRMPEGASSEGEKPLALDRGKMSLVGERFAAGKGMPSDFYLEALSLWGELKAGNPIPEKRIKEIIRGAGSAGELMTALEAMMEGVEPSWAGTLLEVDEQALNKGIKDTRKVLDG